MIAFVLSGETSPKLIVTTRSFCTFALPVTVPFKAPVIVGRPPLLISSACAATGCDTATRINTVRNVKNANRIYGAVTVNVTEMVVVPFSKN